MVISVKLFKGSRERFTQISNEIINDEKISLGAKGLYLYLMSKPDGWNYYIDDMVNRSTDTKYKVKLYLKELESAGYLQRKANKLKNGAFKGWNYFIYETPTGLTEIRTVRNSDGPVYGQSVNDAVNSNTYNNSNTNISNTKDNNIVEQENFEVEEPKKNNKNLEFIKLVIEYLNKKANKNYKYSTPKTQVLIHARTEESFTLEDFKLVIDRKVKQWMNTEFEKFLRPETLFGTKFEGYLNENEGGNSGSSYRNSREKELDKVRNPAGERYIPKGAEVAEADRKKLFELYESKKL